MDNLLGELVRRPATLIYREKVISLEKEHIQVQQQRQNQDDAGTHEDVEEIAH
jgi:hypothetical protein